MVGKPPNRIRSSFFLYANGLQCPRLLNWDTCKHSNTQDCTHSLMCLWGSGLPNTVYLSSGGPAMLPSAMSPLHSLLPEKQPWGEGVRWGSQDFPSTEGPQSRRASKNTEMWTWAQEHDVPDPDQTSSSKTPPKPECQQPTRHRHCLLWQEGILLQYSLSLTTTHAIIMRIGRWQISFHFHTTATRNVE